MFLGILGGISQLGLHIPLGDWFGDLINDIAGLIDKNLYSAIMGSPGFTQGFFETLSGVNIFNQPGSSIDLNTLMKPIFNGFAAAGIAFGSIALMFQVAKMIYQSRGEKVFGPIFLNIVPKFLILVALVTPYPNINGSSILYNFLDWFMNIAGQLGSGPLTWLEGKPGTVTSLGKLAGVGVSSANTSQALSGTSCGGTAMSGWHMVCNAVGGMVSNMSSAGGLAELLFLLALCVFVFYFFILILFRTIALFFAIVLAPIMVGLGMGEWRNKFTQFWAQTFVACVIQPLIMGIGLGIALALAAGIMYPSTNNYNPPGGTFNGILAGAAMILVLFVTGKLVTQFSAHFMGTHSLKDAMLFGAGAATMAIGGGSMARGQASLKGAGDIARGASSGALQSLKDRQASSVNKNTGTGRGNKMATAVAEHSALLGAPLAAASALGNKIVSGSQNRATARYQSAKTRVQTDAALSNRPVSELAKSWAEAKGMDTSNSAEVARQWVNAPENHEVVKHLADHAYGHMDTRDNGSFVKWEDKPAVMEKAKRLQSNANANVTSGRTPPPPPHP